jgi:hypothetical protein
MAEHSYTIANDTGANVRANINNALSAIVSNNSKATEPSTTYAYMWWADTGNDLLKQRNAADSAWISILTLSTGVPSAGGGISNVVEDTTPQLGGDLDLNSNDITGTGGIPSANLTGSVATARLDVGTGANQLVQLDGTAKIPAVDGSQLTNLPASGMPSGTIVAFFQASAPTGWTQNTSHNDKMLRVVSGTGGGTGGTAGISSPAHSLSAGAHTLTTSEMPSHSHSYVTGGGSTWSSTSGVGGGSIYTNTTGSTGSGSSHSHSLSGSITTPLYVDVILAAKD